MQDLDPSKPEWLDALESSSRQRRACSLLLTRMGELATTAAHLCTAISHRIATPSGNPQRHACLATCSWNAAFARCVRWNAMAMVMRTNLKDSAWAVTSQLRFQRNLYDIGFQRYFFQAPTEEIADDLSPALQGHRGKSYARAFMEGRITEEQMNNFPPGSHDSRGLSSYPHPWPGTDFWLPTVSMGPGRSGDLRARFMKYKPWLHP